MVGLRVACAAACVLSVAGCGELGQFGFWDEAAPTGQPLTASATSEDIAGMRLATDRGVEYDVTLYPFGDDERTLVVTRVDQQPMFAAAGDALRAMRATYAAFEADICAGAALEIEDYSYQQPGVWEIEGRCAGVSGEQEMAAPGELAGG